MILVTGGTGTVGREVVKQLAAARAPTRVLVRTPEKAIVLKGIKAEFMVGDLERPATLGPALKGVDHLFLLTSGDPRQAEIQGVLVKAAKAAGVQHVVKLSAMGTDDQSPVALGRWHRQTEKEIEASGMGWTFLRPHFFMQNTLGFAYTVKSQGAFYAPLGDAKISMVDARDIAAVAVKALTAPGHMGKIYDITGPEAVSFNDAAKALSEAAGKPVKYVPVTFAEAKKAMLGLGLHEWLANDLIKLYEIFAAGHGAAVSPVVRQVTGEPGIPYAQFARDNAAAFK
jgi:uncharacterized protein YbjT (DUF2867 family)